MDTSSITHINKDPTLVIRQSYIAICNGDKFAGALLSYFEYWHNVKKAMNVKNKGLNDIAVNNGDIRTQDETDLVYHTKTEIYHQCLGFVSQKGIDSGRQILKELGFITEHSNPNKAYKFDNTVFYRLECAVINKALTSAPALLTQIKEQAKEADIRKKKVRTDWQQNKKQDASSQSGIIGNSDQSGVIHDSKLESLSYQSDTHKNRDYVIDYPEETNEYISQMPSSAGVTNRNKEALFHSEQKEEYQSEQKDSMQPEQTGSVRGVFQPKQKKGIVQRNNSESKSNSLFDTENNIGIPARHDFEMEQQKWGCTALAWHRYSPIIFNWNQRF